MTWRPVTRRGCRSATLLLLAWLALATLPAAAHASDDEEIDYRPGLIVEAEHAGKSGTPQIASTVALRPELLAESARQQPVRARWSGYLMSQNAGPYTIHAHGSGKLTVRLGGVEVLRVETEKVGWSSSEPIHLAFDRHPFEVEYESAGGSARLALYWSGPGFDLEPIGPRQFYHNPKLVPDVSLQRGAELARALRCDACHGSASDQVDPPLPAPALEQLAGNVYRDWVHEWLEATSIAEMDVPDKALGAISSEDDEDELDEDALYDEWGQGSWSPLHRRMPTFRFTDDERRRIVDYLAPSDPALPPADEPSEAVLEEGRTLLFSLGCLACHQWQGLGTAGLFQGGDLSAIAAKRPPQFFALWLADPKQLNEQHRMPVFTLSDKERASLAAVLAQSGEPQPAADMAAVTSLATRRAGAELLVRFRCTACHSSNKLPAVDEVGQLPPLRALDDRSDWGRSCAQQVTGASTQPSYGLSPQAQEALRAYYSNREVQTLVAISPLELRLRENNCTACHSRDEYGGLGAVLQQLAGEQPQLAATLPAFAPPSLSSVGDKLYEDALREAIRRTGKPHRDWLLVRMPRFAFSEDELEQLVEGFVSDDRLPDGAPTSYSLRDIDVPRHIADRLVTPDGFGCTSCHSVGKVQPPKAVLNALGPDLLMLGKRIRRPWFERWVRNPARIVARMEMPSVQTPVAGILDGDLENQLAAVWNALNQPDFKPPAPFPVRVVRRSGVSPRDERAVWITDVAQADEKTYIKPLIIGLANRHNVLFDLEHGRLARWWLGDTARQRTSGKSWYWETGAADLATFERSDAELSLVYADRHEQPIRQGQFITEFDELRHIPGGLAMQYRLHFDSAEPLYVEQRFVAATDRHAFKRMIMVRGVPPEARLRFASGWETTTRGVAIELAAPADAALDAAGSVVLAPSANGEVHIELLYRSELDAGTFASAADHFAAVPGRTESLAIIPGMEAIRLPLPMDVMPTALAWDQNGALLVASLKGQVVRARDTDGDQLEDTWEPVTDELAAPYGIAVRPDGAIDVINKYALLRLLDEDGDGFCERVVTLASGWGHTADYHDWAIGLPQDEQGNYYVAFACQQDKRSAEAARHRGTLVRLVPRSPTHADPRHYKLETISAGHRFPMGLARSAAGDLFVTDNQGNYNPFNELNHVQPGAHFGFINSIERTEGFTPPPITHPAINIPHPWTRSVNGIGFLTPAADGRDFGPFTGHLVGCEYDTRRLIRMSLEKVGDVYQGAAYPLSLYEVEGPTLLGPVACAVSPSGELYIGCLRDSGWGGANNIGGIVRIRLGGTPLPAGVAEVRAVARGFRIEFTAPVDPQLAGDPAQYQIASYERIPTPDYGGPDQNRRTERIHALHVDPGGHSVTVELDALREGFVYEFHLRNLTGTGDVFFPAEAHYTLNRIPQPGSSK